MPAVRAIGILFIALAAGCAGVSQAPPGVAAHPAPLIVDPSLLVTHRGAAVAVAPSRPAVKQETTRAIAPPTAPAKVSATPPAIAPLRKNEDSRPVARTPEPSLDVAALKARLRDTDAIGVFSKLALKNQVDDLLQQFRTHHQSGQKAGVASLRQPYDMLVLKVLALLQDGDPSLARTISGSREAIWGILADPQKFNAIA